MPLLITKKHGKFKFKKVVSFWFNRNNCGYACKFWFQPIADGGKSKG